MQHCPFAGVGVADAVLLLRELEALELLAQVLDKDKSDIERFQEWQLQIARGIRYALQSRVRLPVADGGVKQGFEGFEADSFYFADGFLEAPLSQSALQSPLRPTLLSGLVTASAASGVATLPVLQADQSKQSQEGGGTGTEEDSGSDDSVGGPTWYQQVASVLLSGAFMPPPFVPSLARLKGGLGVPVPRGYGGASLAFNATQRAQGPVWLRVNWLLSSSATAASMPGVGGGLRAASVQAVCNTTFPDGQVTELYSGKDGSPLASKWGNNSADAQGAAALAWLLVGPSPPPVSVPARPSAIFGLAVAVVVELVFVMFMGVACIGIGVQFMRDITVGGQAK